MIDSGRFQEGKMAKKRHTSEQIIRKLREAGIELAKGQAPDLASHASMSSSEAFGLQLRHAG